MASAMGFSKVIWPKGAENKLLCSVPPRPSLMTYTVTPIKRNPHKLFAGPRSNLNTNASPLFVPPMPFLLTYTASPINRKAYKLFVGPQADFNTNMSPLSPAQTIVLFFSAINEKNLKQLDKMIAEDCFFEDCSFPNPFHGKKENILVRVIQPFSSVFDANNTPQEVLHFLEQLIMCMGQNMQFSIEHICEGNDDSVGVNWHLDWNKIQVPFTRGCGNYSLSVNDDKLVIQKAQILIESPIKLGVVALTIFKIVSSLFDAFPAATEWFLTSPHVMFRLLLKTYKSFIGPVLTPFLAWYIKLLNTAACFLGLTFKILQHLANNFHK